MRTLIYVLSIALAVVFLGGCSKSNDDAGADNPADMFARGEEAYFNGDYRQAFELLRQVPEDAPESAEAHHLLGIMHVRQGSNALAILEFNEARRADPKLAAAHRNVGFLYLDEGQFEEAERAFETAIAVDAYDLAAHQGLAETYYKTGRLDEAKAEIRLTEELEMQAAAHSPKDLEIGQRLDVAQAIAEEERMQQTAAKNAAAKPKSAPPPPPKPATVTRQASVASGTIMRLSLSQPLSSATARVGDEVLATVMGEVGSGSDAVIRNGARVKGKVTNVQRSGKVKGRAELAFAFDQVETVVGWRPIKAHMVEGTLQAEGTKKEDAAKIGIGAAAGALLGEVIGDKAAVGAIIGGAAGTAVVLSTRGKEVEVDAGTAFDFQLDEALAVVITTTAPSAD